MKGVNYIPQDVFLNRPSEDDYKKILSAAAEANMNMIRVWGGGIYEKDIFYNLCDEKVCWCGKILCLHVLCTQVTILF